MSDLGDWTPRYHRPIDGELTPETVSNIQADRELLAFFGARMGGLIPGLDIDLPGGGSFQLNDAQWNWLRPLLEKLRGDPRQEVERQLFEAGIIEDPDLDGGLLG